MAVRAVLCDACENIALFFRGLLTHRGPFKAALNTFVAEERTLDDLGA
jgi:hypothetical protein